MPILQTCWSPCWCHSTVKHGTTVIGVYTIVLCIVGIVYCAWVMEGGQSSELYSPFFESDINSTTAIAGGILITYLIIFILFSILLIVGIKYDNRGLLIPYMIWICLLILHTTALGIWFIARYYTYPMSVLSAILTWLFTGLEIYCFLCVLSHYQILKTYHSTNILVLHP